MIRRRTSFISTTFRWSAAPGFSGSGGQPPGCPDHDGSRALADLPDAPPLEKRPDGLRRAHLRELLPARRRPPQVWRATRAIERGLRCLDALVFPSRHSLEEHRRRKIGMHVPLVHLPYFLPDDWSKGIENSPPEILERPYLAAAGRLVKMKGFQRLIPLMRYLPEVDLRLAGTGPSEGELKALAHDLPNVRFEGLLGGAALARLFRNARAVVVPSLFPETFGYVVLESFAVGTPVIVHEGGGALYETGFLSGGGLVLSNRYRASDGDAPNGARSSAA